jgi:hypothetical protein
MSDSRTPLRARSAAPTARISLARWRPVAVDDLVRIGREHDGGYVVSARAVAASRVLIGLGINDDWSFEEEMAERRPALGIIAVDGSISARIFRRRALDAMGRAVAHALRLQRWYALDALRCARRWWVTATRFAAFCAAPARRFHQRFVGAGAGMMRWPELMSAVPAGSTPDLFVKIDIEDAEYDVLPDVLGDAHRIAGMAIEFHSCAKRWEDFARAMDALNEPFAIVHIHGNNYAPLIPGSDVPDVLEVCLVNRALLPATLPPSTAAYPRPELDMPNHPARPDHPLVFDTP